MTTLINLGTMPHLLLAYFVFILKLTIFGCPFFWGHDSFTIVKERSDHPESLGINFSRNIHTPIILVMVQYV
jgi:hypothetical protein